MFQSSKQTISTNIKIFYEMNKQTMKTFPIMEMKQNIFHEISIQFGK